MSELFGVFEGTFEVRARGWAVIQAVAGLINIVVGTILLLAEKKEMVEMSKQGPQFSFVVSENNHKVSVKPLKHKPRVKEIITMFVPQWDAGLAVIVGGGFVVMGILLLLAVHQKSIRKCTIWLVGTIPLCLTVFGSSMYKLYMKPNIHDLTNGPMWIAYGYCIYVIYMYREECVELQLQHQRARIGIINEGKLD